MIVAVIPARYGSTRFPGKPLVAICGRPMIQHVYERVAQAQGVDRVVVATDDERILNAVTAFGGEALLTSPQCPSGTDRVAEVAQKMAARAFINVQGDEPLIHPQAVSMVAYALKEGEKMVTLKTPLEDRRELNNPHVVKVVTDRKGYALYFSRSPIPYPRDEGWGEVDLKGCFKHVGIYGYSRETLLALASWPPSFLEKLEGLEQLRALEGGVKIRVLETEYRAVGVDVPEDVARVEAILKGEDR
ncbi:MAG TPA: 3-deoxy-manno-octulosonate cytidylyltransferase [Thermosulfidibacter takaii]|uniref:3-deoxy-manno-octulosonate cytidylyltransferase n=1 Tax=Thermosulfidibacter takaii TaxID=412593 RepID=A0A7C0U7D6_9BACT|nr:3-deoxy-manno-octulosonate cytidylyltransferase [Thermosulfidibacter takaii]